MMKAEYFALAMRQDCGWLWLCADNPSPSMRPIHVALIRLAIRKKTRC